MPKKRNVTPTQMLMQLGATKLRDSKHEIWLLPNRKTITLSKTPSDHRVIKNQLSDIRRAIKS
jgi:hypothetical protein